MEANALGGLADAHFVRGRAKTAHDHFRRCCDLAREHGFARIEVANMHMLGWTGIFLCAVREAEQTGVEAAERAAKLNQHRAEELACALTAYVMGEYLGNLQGSIAFAEHALRLSRSLGSKRFQARTLCDLARVIWRAGDRARASTLLEESLWLSRETGMRFVGPRILSSLALFTDEPEVRRAALSEAEGILREGCVGHNYLWFYADAIELDLDAGNWEGVERNAIALEAYTRPEPLPWSELVIERGRALTAYGRGSREPALRRNLSELRDRVAGMPWHWMLPRLERALAAW
jgi:tetratricopeptide (TPR) repeat protein